MVSFLRERIKTTFSAAMCEIRGSWKLVISDVSGIAMSASDDVIILLRPILKCETDLRYGTLVCSEQNSLSRYCQVNLPAIAFVV